MPTEGTGVDDAVRAARAVVGLYGDAGVTWSIMLRTRWATALDADEVAARLAAVAAEHPHLGRPATLVRYSAEQEESVVEELANRPYGDRDPLARVALDETGHSLVVAMHHGAGDGLGMMGLTAAVSGHELTCSAQGIPRESEPQNFFTRSSKRLVEALTRPPVRITPSGTAGAHGDHLREWLGNWQRPGTASAVAAAVAATRAWNARRTRAPGKSLVVAIGLSRRPGAPTPPPDRDTAYARVRADGVHSVEQAREALVATEPEPEFPAREEPGVTGRLVKLLEHRLGSTVLVSNLGLLRHPELREATLWPAPSGPAGVCIGVIGSPAGTAVTVRMRRGWFDAADADEMLDLVTDQVVLLSAT